MRAVGTTTYAWLVLAFPLAGMLAIAFGYRVLGALAPRSAGWSGTGAILLSFAAAIAR